jgi:demethoxyubiquinone hydroxylase (CLK1/Coq7/Cat5 family)
MRSKKKIRNTVAQELRENRHYRHRIVELRDNDFRLSKKELESILEEVRKEEDEHIQDRVSEDNLRTEVPT